MLIDAISEEIERAIEHGHKRVNLVLYISQAAFEAIYAELDGLSYVKEVRITWDNLQMARYGCRFGDFMFEGVKLRAAEFGGGWILLDEKEIFQNLRLSQNFL